MQFENFVVNPTDRRLYDVEEESAAKVETHCSARSGDSIEETSRTDLSEG